MRWLSIFFLLACSLHCGSPAREATAPAALQPAKSGLVVDPDIPIRTMRGPGQLIAVLVPLEVPDGDSPIALLRLSGIDSPISGVPLLATRFVSGTISVTWRVQLDRKERAVLSTWSIRPDETLLSLPAMGPSFARQDETLRKDDLLLGTVDPQNILAEYEKRVADGSVAQLERFHREPKVAERDDVIRRRLAKVEQSCGKKVQASMDWSPVGDDEIARSTHCFGIIAALDALCQRDAAGKRAVGQSIDSVVCTRRETATLTLGDDRVLRSGEPKSAAGFSDAPKAKKDGYTRLREVLKLTRTVLKSAGGLVLVLDPDAAHGDLYVGRDRTLYKQKQGSNSTRSRSLWNGARSVDVVRKELGRWRAECPAGPVDFIEVGDKLRIETLANAKLSPIVWKRAPYALARDDRGTYYYVDRQRKALGGKGYRVFKGPRGAVKLTKLVDIVDDSDGMIFATTKGKLRLVVGGKTPDEARWIEGRKERELVSLPIGKNRAFIYGDLGVYEGEPLGTVCDM